MTNRVHIDAPAGVIEIEGEKDFVEGLLAKLFPLIEEAGFGSRPIQNEDAPVDQRTANIALIDEVSEDNESNTKPKAKRKRSATPKGHTCADRILTLRSDGFFKEKRGVGEIVAGLARKGFTHNSNQVSAAGESLFKRNLLQRMKDGANPFKYYWDRE